MPGIRLLTTGIALVASLVMLTLATDIVVDWAWFSDLGYRDVFRTTLATKASVFLLVFTVTPPFSGRMAGLPSDSADQQSRGGR